jgi:hypothetical protein
LLHLQLFYFYLNRVPSLFVMQSKAVQQIHSETQRMVRESRVSLPYHKPRQRSLAEFLQRRHAAVPSVSSLKMSKNDLGELW